MENHDGPPYFYLLAILVGFFPWSVFAGPVLIDIVGRLRRRDPWSHGYVLAACWAGVYIVIFSLAKTKLPSYVTPCYPALALMSGCFVYHWTRGASLAPRIWPRLSVASLALVGLLMLIAIPLVARQLLPGHEWLGGIGLVLLCGAGGCAWLMYRNGAAHAAHLFAMTATTFTVLMFGFITVEVDRHQQSQVLFDEIARRSPDPQIGSYGCLESTWVFYSRRPIHELLPPANATPAKEGVTLPPPRQDVWKRKPGIEIRSFLSHDSETFVITTRRSLLSIEAHLPADIEVLAETPYFLKKESLVLLGRKTTPVVETANRQSCELPQTPR
jgi:hypothetical protein